MTELNAEATTLARFLESRRSVVVLTGAGVSAGSGIPTYRDNKGQWLPGAPVQHRDFLRDRVTRRRYWARSRLGWPLVRDALPNPAHTALAELERRRYIELLITQNVDRLHQRAGSRNVVDLHGRVDRVRCMSCDSYHDREDIQHQLEEHNPHIPAGGIAPAPDGDMVIEPGTEAGFVLPHCPACAADVIPDVVFFGGSVPGDTLTSCMEALERSKGLVAIGSSLMVFSGYRFCRRAKERNLPLLIINPGITRADTLADIKLQSDAGALLHAALVKLRH